ncbi:hypothetical protein [Dickeya sp. NCPPB 3274]|uniref:hypothetical protein n=1 Tax=Dickeya sp. NCPPB 3274 TaxID=568766 RepID=UPI0005B33FE6|nr:hypothetical protein [Dickeya sp. NCPPB 3274]
MTPMKDAEVETVRAVIARATHVAANSFGGVIGEHEELVETLRKAGFTSIVSVVDAIYEGVCVASQDTTRKSWIAKLHQISADLKVRVAIHDYEALCDGNRAQSMAAKGLLKFIMTALKFRGLEYNTLNLARLGSKRSLYYMSRGHVDGYALDRQGNVINLDECHAAALEMNRAFDLNIKEKEVQADTLCRGFRMKYSYVRGVRQFKSDMPVEKLYAVLPDGRVFRSEEIELPNQYFDAPDREWTFMPNLTIDDVKLMFAEFCGRYPKPASIQ